MNLRKIDTFMNILVFVLTACLIILYYLTTIPNSSALPALQATDKKKSLHSKQILPKIDEREAPKLLQNDNVIHSSAKEPIKVIVVSTSLEQRILVQKTISSGAQL
jgi:hypothetical protein